MRVPQVSERIKEAPAQALRGVFAGIGQLLLITDKLRNKTPTYNPVPRSPKAEPAQDVTDTTASAPADQRAETAAPAQAEPLPAEPVLAEPVLAEPVLAEPVVAEVPKAAQPRDFDKTGNVRLLDEETDTAAPAETKPADSAAPLPNYDELSIASLRARLRNLDVTQVRELADYERAHEARADVISMFERRIAKLEAEA